MRFPGAAGRIPNFAGAEAAADRLRGMEEWQVAATLKANPDSAQLPVRQRALEDGKVLYMAVPRLPSPEPFFALDPAHLAESPRKAASIGGAARAGKRVALAELSPVDLVVMGSVAASEDGAAGNVGLGRSHIVTERGSAGKRLRARIAGREEPALDRHACRHPRRAGTHLDHNRPAISQPEPDHRREVPGPEDLIGRRAAEMLHAPVRKAARIDVTRPR